MTFRHVIHDGQSFYYIDGAGGLRWYRDADGSGKDRWAPNSGNQIGVGWQNFVHIFAGSRTGEFYTTDTGGNLRWYRDLLCDGSNDPGGMSGWHPRSGSIVGHNWLPLRYIFPGPNGVIYAVKPDGDLLWYRHVHRPGDPGEAIGRVGGPPIFWANNGAGTRIGIGWDKIHGLTTSRRAAPPQSSNDYVIYAVREDGALCWYQDQRADGTSAPDGTGWAALSGTAIGSGWRHMPLLVAGATGVLYLAKPDGGLYWYQDMTRDGGSRPDGWGWASNSDSKIGEGWIPYQDPALPPSDGGHDDDDGGGTVDSSPPQVPDDTGNPSGFPAL